MKPLLFTCALLLGAALPAAAGGRAAGDTPAWNMNATVVEACSCPVFCQCFFNTSPAGHSAHEMSGMGHDTHAAAASGEGGGVEHYCRFNNAYRVNHGSYGATKLDGAKFWIYGDLGSDFSKGNTDWAVVTFDRATTPEQRAGLTEILAHVFPVKWNSLRTAEGDIDWNNGKDEAYATLDGGKTAEVRLKRFAGTNGGPVVIQGLPYFGATDNGFLVMPNTVEALYAGDKAFQFHGTNGFVTTLTMDSKTPKPAGMP